MADGHRVAPKDVPPPADRSSEVTANLVHGAPVAEAMSPPGADAVSATKIQAGTLESSGNISAIPYVKMTDASAPHQSVMAQMTREFAIGMSGLQELMQSRTPVEFFFVQGRLASEFWERVRQRSSAAFNSLPSLDKRRRFRVV